jgi:hypothetical protein
MAATYVTRNTVFAATPGAKTLLKLITPTAFSIGIHEIGVSMDGVTPTAVPATFEWGTSDETTAGTGTGAAVTTQINGRVLTDGLTVTQNHSAEGTVYVVHAGVFVPQYMGIFVLQNPLGLEPESPTPAADAFFLRINVSANVNVLSWVKWSRV